MKYEVNGKKYNISKIAEFKNNGFLSGCHFLISVFSKTWNECVTLGNFETEEKAIEWINSRN
jgi:hypothetical protein